MATFYTAFKNRTIKIPNIQRDYIQSFDKELINGFIEVLVDSLDTEEKINLNYLYGIKNENCFIPIDGQQRLTTLWLLHLYIAANVHPEEQMTVQLDYRTREYAQDFCNELNQKGHLKDLVNSNEELPSKFIPNQPWFISSWLNDISIVAMLQTLDVIKINLSRRDNLKSLWDKLTHFNCPIIFSFKETDDLGDDIYIKMNGRGRTLTDFENLKSWIDGKLQELTSADDKFLEDWRQKMDNEWTDFFWNNRNLNDTYPEDIDDKQLRFFYNMLLLYWTKQDCPEVMVESINYEDVKRLLNISDSDKIVATILDRIRQSKGYELPLYLLDKLNLFTMEFFRWTYDVINGLIRYDGESIQYVDCNIFFWDKPQEEKPISLMCQMLFEEKSYNTIPYAKLALCNALSSYVILEDPKTSLFDWMYRMRNLITNTEINNNNFKKVLLSIDKLASKCKSEPIDSILNTEIEAFDKKQVEEEGYKSKIILQNKKELIDDMRKLENLPFFTGQIGFMFDFVGQDPFAANYTSHFKEYSTIMSTLFEKDGPEKIIMEDFSLYRALMCFTTPYTYGYEERGTWCFLKDKSHWKRFISDNKIHDKQEHNGSLKILIEDIIKNVPKEQLSDIKEIHEHLLSIIKKEITNQTINDWRRFFIHHQEVWSYMEQKCIKFTTEYDIFLLPKLQFRSDSYRAELRAYCLYLDYKNHVAQNIDGHYYIKDWQIHFWKQKDTCLYFEKQKGEDCLAIDVYFDRGHKTEDAYVLNIFVRSKEGESEDRFQERNMKHFNGIEELDYTEKRYRTKQKTLLSIKELINKLLELY